MFAKTSILKGGTEEKVKELWEPALLESWIWSKHHKLVVWPAAFLEVSVFSFKKCELISQGPGFWLAVGSSENLRAYSMLGTDVG